MFCSRAEPRASTPGHGQLFIGPILGSMMAFGLGCSSDSEEPKRASGSHGATADPDVDAAGMGAGDGDAPSDERPAGNEPGASELDAQQACAKIETTPVRTIPSVVFLVDGSSSMKCVYPEDESCDCAAQVAKTCTGMGDKSRWQALSEALVGQGGDPGLFVNLNHLIRFGLWIYNDNPKIVGSACPGFTTQVDPALDQAGPLSAAFPPLPPGEGTPTGVALSALVEALPEPAQRDQLKLGPQRIVLATDGQPFECMDRETLAAPALDYGGVLAATDKARAKDVDVYVMSLAPTSGEFASHLAEVAKRGNTSAAYAPANKGELSAALKDIIESAISCTVELEGEIEEPGTCPGEGSLNGDLLDCGDPNGFTIIDKSHVRLEGDACRRFKSEPGVELVMTFDCASFTLQ